MKLFAPTQPSANWDMTRSDSWWNVVGSVPTSSGVRVGRESATSLSAALAATRVISETLASLPLAILRQVDNRTTEKAMDHPLWSVLHDAPHPEQDIVAWLDMQVALQVNWGNAYAEIERRAGEVYALWPIHPSRIPTRNITRNPVDPPGWREIVAGQPGEVVFWVNNEDGSKTPVPASDMLHVPGVLSENGVTGVSVPMKGANGIGIAMATEQHAGSFFRNGAISNMALKSQKIVGREVSERLREQWQKTFGGVANHYKTLLLEDGVEPVPFSIAPEAAQLIEARKFSVAEIARIYKVPPHTIGDLERAIHNNIESQQLSFVVHTMLPWIVRWEKAMHRQLLTVEEKREYRFKFNVMGLLRGDSEARAQLYDRLFNMAAASPNDIRDWEDLNPIEGGDQYFIPGNNLIPLDKIGEKVQSEIDAANKPDPVPQAPQRDEMMNVLATWMSGQESAAQGMLSELLKRFDASEAAISDKLDGSTERIVAAMPQVDLQPIIESVKQECVELAQSMPKPDSADEIGENLFARLEPEFAKLTGAVNGIEQPNLEPLSEAIQAYHDEVKSLPSPPSVEEFTAQVTEIVSEFTESLSAAINEMTPEPPDTSHAEELAVREAQLEERAKEVEERMAAERQLAQEVIALALKRDIDKLTEWEWKWLSKAVEEPSKWVDARVKYYQRFNRYFIANLKEYLGPAEACGLILDLEWGSFRYSKQSVDDLKTLDATAADNYHDRLKECVHHFRDRQWTDRSQTLVSEMIERGKRLYAEREEKNEQAD